MNKTKNVLLVILTILLFIFVKNYFSKSNQLSESKSLLLSLNSALEISKNKLGQEVAKREIIETYNTKMFTRMELQDSALKDLQKLVKDNRKLIKNSGSATILKGETNVDKSTVTNIYYPSGDTLPTYTSNFNNEWVGYSIISKFDTTKLDLKIKNKYSIVIGSEKKNIFTKRKPFATVTNFNPYSTNTELRTYQVKIKRKKFGIGVQVGYGITKAGLSPYVGLGGHYSLFKF